MKKEKETKQKQLVCSKCGEIIEGNDYQEINGEIVCQNCLDNDYFICDDCGELVERDYGYYIDSEDKLVCENCLDNGYGMCHHCNQYFSEDDLYYVNNRDYYVCGDCRDHNDYYYCNGCDNLFHIDDLHYSEYHDCDYCDDCYDEYCDEDEGLLYDYHEFRDWEFFKGANEEEPPYYIGKEIELEPKSYSNVEKVLDIMNNYINGVGMHDGSLEEGGVEVVTHPESWQYLQEHKEDYRQFFKEIEDIKYGDAGDTGLHFHISRPNDNVISRLIVIIESFKEEIQKLSRRNGDFQWSRFLTDLERDNSEKLKYQSTKYIKEKYLTTGHDRYLALNLCNSKTIEFRFFNGANNFEEFWGAMQFIHNLMEIALDEDRDLNTISWNELIYGDELLEQARKQEVLGINKYAKDTSEIVVKIEKLREDTKEEIKNTLKNFVRYITREMENKRLDIINRNDIEAIENTGRRFIDDLTSDLNYLHSVNQVYNSIEFSTINTIKTSINNIKESNVITRLTNDKYNNYFEQLDKTIENFEMEMNK